jgi:hypothetical protein
MNTIKIATALAFATALFAVPAAFADVLPPNACKAEDKGKSCTAGNVKGICQERTCSRATPNGPVSYTCYLCEADANSMGGCHMGGASTPAALGLLLGISSLALRLRKR